MASICRFLDFVRNTATFAANRHVACSKDTKKCVCGRVSEHTRFGVFRTRVTCLIAADVVCPRWVGSNSAPQISYILSRGHFEAGQRQGIKKRRRGKREGREGRGKEARKDINVCLRPRLKRSGESVADPRHDHWQLETDSHYKLSISHRRLFWWAS